MPHPGDFGFTLVGFFLEDDLAFGFGI